MNEWSIFCANGGEGNVSVVFFVQMVGTNPGKWESVLRGKNKVAKSMMAKFKMVAIIKLSENEWV